MTSKALVALCFGGAIVSGAMAGFAVAWLRPAPQPAPAAVRASSRAEAPARALQPDLGDVEGRIAELEERVEAMQAQERARRSLHKYAEAVAAEAKESGNDNGPKDEKKPRAGGVIDAEDPAFELAVRSVLDHADWEKEEERKVTRAQRRDERARRQVELYTERLQLSPEQQTAFAAVLAKQMDQYRVWREEDESQAAPVTRAERRQRGEQVRTETEQRLAEVLTPEQLASYKTMSEQESSARRERAAPAGSAPAQ
jgi:hypothetical protein